MSEVFLERYTPNPEDLIAKAAKLCYSPEDITKLNLHENDVPKFIKKLVELGHLSPFEHANFTFGIKCSRACSHQIVRHRIASFSQKSQRYVTEDQFDYYTPSSIKESECLDDYDRLMIQIQNFYNYLGRCDIPNEDKRFILPNACQTQLFMTMNARELVHFFNIRCCNRAQWEIRDISIEMLSLVRKIAPNVFGNAGPNCLRGKCPEGKMTCGKSDVVREKFKNL